MTEYEKNKEGERGEERRGKDGGEVRASFKCSTSEKMTL
jgi:hypothetical protein